MPRHRNYSTCIISSDYPARTQEEHEEGEKWLRRAAEQGHVQAQYNLGEMFVHGGCVARDDAEAEKWIKWWEKWGGEKMTGGRIRSWIRGANGVKFARWDFDDTTARKGKE